MVRLVCGVLSDLLPGCTANGPVIPGMAQACLALIWDEAMQPQLLSPRSME